MRLNSGIQKYREAARGTDAKKKKDVREAKVEAKNSKEREQSSSKEKEKEQKNAKAKAPTAAMTEGKVPSKRSAKVSEEEAEMLRKAAEEAKVAAEAAQEEAAIQKEIAEELERESATTAALVKEDFSPVNCPRERLVTEYAPLIKYIAQKIAARLPANIELDDLISSGVIGLMDAIEKYDSSRDNKFKTYAEFRIRGAILDELRAQDWVPRSVREKAKLLERCYQKIEQTKGRQATDDEVCEELKLSTDEFHDLLNQVRSVSLLSYDDILNFSKADKRALHGFGENGSRVPTPFSEVSLASIKKVISEAIRDLPEKQRLVLSLYYYEDLNLKEIGRVLDVTESRVSQLHTQAVMRLKAKLRGHIEELCIAFG